MPIYSAPAGNSEAGDVDCTEYRKVYYRAMLCIRGTSHGSVSICVCVHVCHKSVFYRNG